LGHPRSGSGLDAVNRWIPDPIRIQNRNTDYAYIKNKAEFNYLAAAPWWACGGSWFHASTAVPSSHPHPFPRFVPLLCQLCFSGFPLLPTVFQQMIKMSILLQHTKDGIFKLLRSPGIIFKESITPASVAWLAGTTTLFLLGF
jgi:hypothetical protein